LPASSLSITGSHFDGGPDALVCPATADVACHCPLDVRIRWIWTSREQSRSLHDLTALAVTALWDVESSPGALHGMIPFFAQPLNGHHLLIVQCRHFCLTRADRLAVHMNRACPAEPKAAPESSAGHAQIIAKMPKQRHLVVAIECARRPINIEINHALLLRSSSGLSHSFDFTFAARIKSQKIMDTEIIVVGAGPVGLTAALALRSLGRQVTVLEAEAQDRIRPGSRAIFIHRDSLMVLEKIQAGLGRQLNTHGLTWQTKRTFYRGREIFSRSYPPHQGNDLPAATSLPQVVTEQVLYQASLKAGVDFVWNTPVTRASAENGIVALVTATGSSFKARYVIAADGSRSAVRESAGLKLEGPHTTNAFVIVDTAEDPSNPLPIERIFHYEHPGAGGRNVLFVPFAGHWRIDLQCHPPDVPETFSGVDGVRKWLPSVIRPDYADRITWVSTYIFRQAVANSFTDSHRRILLTGEAAHVFAPFGARGLNSGIPDAFLAAVAVDRAMKSNSAKEAEDAVDHFATLRRAAALRNRAASNVALSHLTAPTSFLRLKRRTAAMLAPLIPAAGHWLDSAPYGPPLGPADADGMRY
jgi:3-(3-hydroxy-phenyl)propionate hydroxylase